MNSRELQVPRISSCDEEMRKATGIGAEQKWTRGGGSKPFVAWRNSNGDKSRVEADARGVGVHSRIGSVAETLWQVDCRRIESVGVSTGNEWIGPATEFPFLLGT